MRLTILALAWVTPAVTAELFGWKGIWGSGSAFFDALVPIPVAGGVLHVPSFALGAAVIWTGHRLPSSLGRVLPVAAAGVLAGMIALQIDFSRFNAWLFTDYQPPGSPVRLDSNLLYLFITFDAFWVLFYALAAGNRPPAKLWALLPLVPVCVVGFQVATYRFGGPEFKIGGSFPGKQRGQETRMVYTSAGYDRKLLLDWFETKGYLARPWQTPNAEHCAVHFTSSMQAVKWGRFDDLSDKNTIATICLYEEDRSMEIRKGYVNCFEGRDTMAETIKKTATANPTGLGRDLDFWHARVMVCKAVEVPEGYVGNIALVNGCRSLVENHERKKQQIINRYGPDSPEVEFFKAVSLDAGLGQ